MVPSLTQQQQQPQTPVTGAGMSTDNMQAMMDKAKMFSDSELADILMGKSMAIPQFVAMTEAMGRKQLRTAMDGAQAQQQGKQPTVKDQLTADEIQAAQQAVQQTAMPTGEQPAEIQGIAALPAPNMQEAAMAAGGIIAFDRGGDVPRFNEGGNWFTEWRDSLSSPEEKRYENIKRGKATDAPTDTLSENQMNAVLTGKTPGPAEVPMPPASMQKEIDDSKMRLFKEEMAAKEARENTKPTGIQTVANPADVKAISQRIDPKVVKKLTDEEKVTPPPAPRKDAFAGMESGKEELDKKVQSEKDFAAGAYLMQLGLSVMSVPNVGRALAQGNEKALPGLVASRKTINELEKNQKDYNFNLAKAKEARDQGNEELALKHEELAQKTLYQTGVLAVENRKAGAEELRAGAYANQVGSKKDIAQEKLDAAIGSGAVNMHNKNMADFSFARKFDKMTTEQQNAYFADLRRQAAGLYGKNESGSGFSMDAIDAAIARKEKKS